MSLPQATNLGDSSSEEEATGLEVADTRVGWIYKLRKEELANELRRFNLETGGRVDEMRQRLSIFLRQGVQPPYTPPPVPTNPPEPNKCDQVRKWNLHFDGKTDAISFLERVEELRECYGLSPEQLLQAIPEMLRGDAILWYRNNKDSWRDWSGFVSAFWGFYLPADYQLQLEEEIGRRRQRPNKKGKVFVVALQSLVRRHGNLTEQQLLHRLYRNLLPEYRQYIRRTDFTNVIELTQKVEDFEQLQEEVRSLKISRPPNPDRYTWPNRRPQPLAATRVQDDTPEPNSQLPPRPARYEPDITCWRCGQRGRFNADCRIQARLFFTRCGRPGTLSRDCKCPRPNQGNAAWAGTSFGTASPPR